MAAMIGVASQAFSIMKCHALVGAPKVDVLVAVGEDEDEVGVDVSEESVLFASIKRP